MELPRILQVARMGHPVLHQPCTDVGNPTDQKILKLIADMQATISYVGSTGLAAPQVFVPLRVVVYRLRPSDAPDNMPIDDYPWTVMINPQITQTSEKMTSRWESCLSIPEMAGYVPRYDAVTCQYLDTQGTTHTIEARGYKARVLQHECDHINGILYPHHLESYRHFGFRDTIKQDGLPASS